MIRGEFTMIAIGQDAPFLNGERRRNKNMIDYFCTLQIGAESIKGTVIGIRMLHLLLGIF